AAVDVRGAGRDDDPARSLLEDAAEGRLQLALRAAVSLPLCVRRIAQQEEDALLAEPAEPVDVGPASERGVLLQLEVAGVEDAAHRSLDRQRDRVGDAVADGDGLDPEGADLDAVADPDRAQVGLVQHAVLAKAGLGQAEREGSAVYRYLKPSEVERQPSQLV